MASDRYYVEPGSHSGHCCFVASVIDRDLEKATDPFIVPAVCECFTQHQAERIAALLNAAEDNTDTETEGATDQENRALRAEPEPSQQEALEALERVIYDDYDRDEQGNADQRPVDIATIRAALQRQRVPEGWQVFRHGQSIIVDGGPGIGARLTPDNEQARLDTLYQFVDALLAAAPDQQEGRGDG